MLNTFACLAFDLFSKVGDIVERRQVVDMDAIWICANSLHLLFIHVVSDANCKHCQFGVMDLQRISMSFIQRGKGVTVSLLHRQLVQCQQCPEIDHLS